MASLVKGSQRIEGDVDTVIGVEDQPIIIYYIIARSTDGASVVTLHDGDATADPEADVINMAAGATTTRVDYGANGLFLKTGAFIQTDAKTDFVYVVYEMVNT